MSLPEVMPWRRLRMRPDGLKFRRRHPLAGYVLDVHCPTGRRTIEIDGEAHDRGDRPMRDARRDRALAERGLRVVRTPAADELADIEATVDAVVALAIPLHQPAAGPPPHARHGEDFTSGAA